MQWGSRIVIKARDLLLIFCFLFPSVLEAKKILSLSPAISVILKELNAQEEVVGVTVQDYVLKRQRVGSFIKLSLEAIIALAPDLIIFQGFQEAQLAPIIQLNRFQMLKVEFTDVASIFDAGLKISKVLGHSSKQVQEFREAWKKFRKQFKSPQALRFIALVEYIGDFEQIFAMGQNSYLSEMLEDLGFQNYLVSNKDYLKISREVFYQKQKPDMILNFSLVPYPKGCYRDIPVINLNERLLTLPSLELSDKAKLILEKIALGIHK